MLEQANGPPHQALAARLVHALAQLAASADDATAAAALGQPSSYALLLELLTAPAALECVRDEDPLGTLALPVLGALLDRYGFSLRP